MLCASFSRCPASSRDAMIFYPWRIVRKRLLPSLPVLPCPFVRLKVVTDGALQVGFSFCLRSVNLAGSIAGRGSFQLLQTHSWLVSRHALPLLREEGERRLNSAVYSLSEAHPPAVRAPALLQIRRPGSRNTPAVIPVRCQAVQRQSVWCEIHAVASSTVK